MLTHWTFRFRGGLFDGHEHPADPFQMPPHMQPPPELALYSYPEGGGDGIRVCTPDHPHLEGRDDAEHYRLAEVENGIRVATYEHEGLRPEPRAGEGEETLEQELAKILPVAA